MPAIYASAPGKAILFGEHAVVYGRPAIAVPVVQVRAKATVTADPRGAPGRVRVAAPDVGLAADLADLPADDPLGAALRGVLAALGASSAPACSIQVTSTIPTASGLGSGAAVAVAAIRAFSAFLGQPLPDEQVNALAYEVEKIHHGTPSGIDNTVITYARPVWFVRGQPLETLRVAHPFTLVIGDSGVPGLTAAAVAGVRARWQAQPTAYERLFDAAGELSHQARRAIERGHPQQMGALMDENHALLREMGVSSDALERLVAAARAAGAWGAKLSGGGQGGNMIALVDDAAAADVAGALSRAGATHTIVTPVRPS